MFEVVVQRSELAQIPRTRAPKTTAVKIALNIVKDKENVNRLDDILKNWFGPEAGATGTSHFVEFSKYQKSKMFFW